ncbi:response regulator [Aquabacter cavernae]|uniref:response regulator n=1 Tax=Aquabacter cavernae TaxID=2496029 RepID=UPI00196AF198|nr:response regulator [Aquabacter cavernae]
MARTVLVVEDEPLLRLVLSDLLRARGITVVEAASAGEALDLLAAGVEADLIFTDVRMPGPIDGLELSRRVRATCPDLPVVVTSGHLESSLVDPGVAFLRKPYLPADAVSAILAIMERR